VRDAHKDGAHVLPGEGTDDTLERILWLAAEHGRESEPDHEVGDLQAALALAFHWLNPLQKESLLEQVEEEADARR